jgi:transposase
MNTTTIGVDLAKSVFQLSLANQSGKITERNRLTRGQFERFLYQQSQSTLVMEACGTAHYWARTAADAGHEVVLLHPGYVKPYVRRNKTDAADADALVQASRDPELKPVPAKSIDQQAMQSVHRIRQQLMDTRKRRINLARSLLAEFGIPLPTGTRDIAARLRAHEEVLPALLVQALDPVIDEITALKQRIEALDAQLIVFANDHPVVQQLMTVPGIGVTTATALFGSVPDIHQFKRARQFSSWLGLTPREFSSGNKRVLGRISKRGDKYLRMLLIHGARAALLAAHRKRANGKPVTRLQQWATDLQQNKHHNIATVALANKMARIIWAMWTKGDEYRAK